MRIQNNIMAINTHRQYGINNTNIAKSLEKLSSGYRVNRAGDDAAGLAISEKMRAQIRGLNMASKNSQDAISMVQTAEGALQSTHNILQRMRELAVQSASDTNEQTIDRAALQQEFAALKAEVDDIAAKTRFNDQNLIDGTFQKSKTYLDGTGTSFAATAFNGNRLTILTDKAAAGTYTVTVKAVAAQDAKIVAGTAAVATPASSTALTAYSGANATGGINDFGDITAAGFVFTGIETGDHNGNVYTFKVDGSKADSLTVSLLDSKGKIVSQIQNFDGTGGAGATFILNFEGVGTYEILSGADAAIGGATPDLMAAGAAAWASLLDGKTLTFDKAGISPGTIPAKPGRIDVDINGDKVSLYHGDTSAIFNSVGIQFSFSAISDADFLTDTAKFTGDKIVVKEVVGQSFVVQAGANQGDELTINIDAMNTRMLGIAFSDISTQKAASKSITEVNNAINQVSTQRAALGALQNRLEFKIANLDTGAENLQAAESRIRDLDMAKEMTNFTKSNILAQAATAMLAQANALPQGVLQLLK